MARISRDLVVLLLGCSMLVLGNPLHGANSRTAWINELSWAGEAIWHFQRIHHRLPDDVRDAQGQPILSWRVETLPFLDSGFLDVRMAHTKAWNDPANLPFAEDCPIPYIDRLPGDDKFTKGSTPVALVRGKNTFFGEGGRPVWRDPAQDWSKKIMLVEVDAEQARKWSEPGDWWFDPADPFRGLRMHQRQNFLYGPGCFVVMGDRKARFLPRSLDEERMRQLIDVEDAAEPLPLEFGWLGAMLHTPAAQILIPVVSFSVIAVAGAVLFLIRCRRTKVSSPGEFLWMILGAQQAVLLLAIVIDYRFELVPPAYRAANHVPYWPAPLAAAAVMSFPRRPFITRRARMANVLLDVVHELLPGGGLVVPRSSALLHRRSTDGGGRAVLVGRGGVLRDNLLDHED